MKGRLVSPTEFNDWDTEIGNFGFGYTDFATGKGWFKKKILLFLSFLKLIISVSLHYVKYFAYNILSRNGKIVIKKPCSFFGY